MVLNLGVVSPIFFGPKSLRFSGAKKWDFGCPNPKTDVDRSRLGIDVPMDWIDDK